MSPPEKTPYERFVEAAKLVLSVPKKEVDKLVEVGNPVTRERQLIEMGECVNCKSLDNRISVFILIETLREISRIYNNDGMRQSFGSVPNS